AGSAANTTYLDLASATVGNLLSTIDGLSGAGSGTATINSSGAITLHSGITNDLKITSTNTTAFGALGLTSPVTLPRTGGGTAGTGQVLGSDLQAFINESVSGGAVTSYDISRSPVSRNLP